MIGEVATGRRAIKSGTEYNKYFDLSDLEGTDPILNHDGSNYDTLRLIDKMARDYSYQTKAIADHLKGRTLEESLKNLYDFLYNHVQYKIDAATKEQLRTPLRTWKDRHTGVDCDCFSIFIKSVLINWGVSNASRMASYKDGESSGLLGFDFKTLATVGGTLIVVILVSWLIMSLVDNPKKKAA
jgi:hypothetical protein